jgi:IclR family transcriptional regulator, KDG regulon repressor
MRLTPAVTRAADMVDLIAAAGEPLSVATLARELGIPRNTAHEIANTLVARRLLRALGDGRLGLGLRLFELGSAYAATLDLLTEARPVVEEVVGACNETTNLSVLNGRHVVYLIKRESSRPVRAISVVGGRIPAHATAVGKSILATLPLDEVVRRLGDGPLERLTPGTITDVRALVRQLAEVVERGYAIDEEESSPEVCCVAACIRDRTGAAVGGMSISAPRSRMTPERREELAALVIGATDRLSRRLGFTPPAEAGVRPAALVAARE